MPKPLRGRRSWIPGIYDETLGFYMGLSVVFALGMAAGAVCVIAWLVVR